MQTHQLLTMAVALTLSGFAGRVQAQQNQMKEDLAKRCTDVHWPKEFRPEEADLFSHNEIFIEAADSVIFRHILEAAKWPDWYSNAHNVRVAASSTGRLKANAQFYWNTFGLDIHSCVHELATNRRIGWFGDGKDLHAYHLWILIPKAKGTLVITEESVKGPGAVALRKSDVGAIHRGHDLWDRSLKKLSEN